MKKIISIIIPILACLLNAPVQAGTCDVWGNQDFTVTFNVVGPASNSYVYLDHSGSHPREVLWYNGYEYGNANYYFDEPNLLAGQPYNIRLEHQVSHNSGTLKYYRKFAGGSEWQLIDVKNDVDLKNGKLTLYDQGSPSQVDCSGSTPDPVEPEVPDDVCQYFPQPIQGMKGYTENTLNVPNKSARALGWSEEYKSYYTVTNKEDLFYYSPNAQQPNKPQYILAGFDKANVDDARDRLYRSPICGSDTGCDVGNIDGYLESRKANEPLGVATNFGDGSLHITAENIEQICSNNSLCRANTYSVDGKTGIEIQVISNLDTLDINQYNSPYDQVKVVLPNQTNIGTLVMEVGPSDDVRLVIPEDAEVTLGEWAHTGHGKYSFFNQSKINVSGKSVVFNNPITVTTEYYVTLYAPDADILFKTNNPSFYGFILANSISFENPITVYGSVTTRHLTMKNGVVIQKPDYSCPIAPPVQQCTLLPMETFSSNNIDNWSVIGYGNSVKPTVENGRFRLNGNTPRQATASAYNYIFPSNENYLEIEFDHYAYGGGSNGADGVALVISDANVPPQTGAFGGPLGYGMKLRKNHSGEVSQDVEGFAGGWLGIGIDEYGNFYREGGVQLASRGKANNVGIRGAGVKDRNGKWLEGYQYIKGHQFDGDLDNRENVRHRYKVILNSRKSGVITLSVQRKIKNGQWSSVISDFDVLTAGNFNYTPDNFRISVTASTGALTNTHEMDDFQVCADKYQKITEGIHHFEFDYAGTGSICQASEVTLRACMNDSCSKTYPASVLSSNPGASIDPVTVSLLPQSSSVVKWEGGDSVTFSDSISLKLQAYQSGSAKLGIASSSVPQFGFEGAKCRIAGGALSEQNCNILFNSAALGVNIPDKVAGKPFFTDGTPLYGIENRPYLEFCSAPSQQDGAGEHRDVIFSVERVEPEKNAVQVETYVSFLTEDGKFSEEVAIDNKASTEIDNVYFDSKGKAYFNLRYPEAGKVALKAKIKGEKDSLGQNSFVSFPAYLQLTVDGGLCGASDSCDKSFVAAGEPFTMKVTAYQFGDDKKPAQNYQQSGLTVSHKVTYPAADAAVSGTLGTTAYDHLNLTKGTGSFEQTISEVGAFEFTITPPETYLGSKSFAITPAKEVIGRFYPKYFRTDEVKNNQWAYPNGQSFTYMEQAFGAKEFYVEALNADKGAVTNYAFFSDGLHARFGLKDTSSYEARFSSNKTYSGAWLNNGTAYVTSRSLGKFAGSTTDGLVFSKGSGASYPDGPLNLYENAKDTTISIEGISANSDPVSIDGNDGVLATQPDIRFGRIDLDDVGGNQGSTLHVPLRVEYWNGSRFIANPNDNQTEVTGVKAAQQHIWPTDQSAKDVTLGEGGIVTSGSSRSVTATQAEPYRQQTRVWLDLDDSANGLPWLKYNWDNKNAGEENPSSVVTFGIHRGNDRVIYRGEPGLTGQ
ncbi:TPA: MSHA biogenesis protein MshQ [Vibrio parahaemolyticus]|nr:MSHA biogenesis protein MshQ [Vibrio parahaemolyticus]HAS6918026.1 MSHA biogenesis protein MshQ [Vibrio parahaemolyticus]HAS6927931.1 MSHA biogenesis protein MshQ [Vibrio parahaemolyticus]